MITFKSIVPWIFEEMRKGRNVEEIFDELGFDAKQRRLEEGLIQEHIFSLQRMRVRKYITVNGKRYQDITNEYIDCGG